MKKKMKEELQKVCETSAEMLCLMLIIAIDYKSKNNNFQPLRPENAINKEADFRALYGGDICVHDEVDKMIPFQVKIEVIWNTNADK